MRKLLNRRIFVWLVVAPLLVVLLWYGARRLMAEYYYAKIISEVGGVEWYDKLTFLGSPSVPVLLRLLEKGDDLDREAAAEGLRYYHTDEVVSALIETVRNDPDGLVTEAAIGSLAYLGDARALPVLKEIGWRDYTARLVLSGKGEDGKLALLEYLSRRTESGNFRASVLEMLCDKFDNDLAVQAEAKAALSDTATEVRVAAARCVSKLFGQGAVVDLKLLLRDSSVSVRVTAAGELGRQGDGSGFELVKSVAFDRTMPMEVRLQAVRGIGFLGGKSKADLLVELRDSNPDWQIRNEAYNTLMSMFPDPRSAEKYRRLPPN